MRWMPIKDGIHPMFVSDCLRVWITRLGRGEWRWTIYRSHAWTSKSSTGTVASEVAAKRDAASAMGITGVKACA